MELFGTGILLVVKEFSLIQWPTHTKSLAIILLSVYEKMVRTVPMHFIQLQGKNKF